MEKIDYTGHVFGWYTVLGDAPTKRIGKKSYRVVFARCKCGTEKEVRLKELRRGKTTSCGCYAESKKLDIPVGYQFNYWTVLGETEPYISKSGKNRQFEVQCVCGKKSKMSPSAIKKGNGVSCGCKTEIIPKGRDLNRPITPLEIEKINEKDFGQWSVLREVSSYRDNKFQIRRRIEAQCSCGLIKEMSLENLTNDKSRSCSKCAGQRIALQKKNPDQKFRRSLAYRLGGMKRRCYDETAKGYSTYGGKGIKICEEWQSIEGFYQWCISQGMTSENCSVLEIDRIDGTKDYCPENCQLLTKDQNSLKTLNMTEEDVRFIRSSEFIWEIHRNNYSCSDNTLLRIKNFITFKNV